jgi:ATP adenylyltransferase
VLNKYPYNNGHLLIAPHRHTAQLADLSGGEFQDLMELLRRAVAVTETALQPQGLNIGMNLGACAGAGVADHLHWHVVPRWAGDTNFMPVVGAVRVLPQHLLESYDRLRPYFTSPPEPAESEPQHSQQR